MSGERERERVESLTEALCHERPATPSLMDKQAIAFEIQARDGEARSGVIRTRRAVIETPVFMPVGTLGTVKGTRFEELEAADLDARIILGNTYHLWLRPGAETVRACGGLHRFMSWRRALLTDSGGFQVWSLGALRRISEAGTEFRSHVDGSLRFLSPEVSMEVQSALGSEIVMAFDECAPGEATHEEARASMELTARWAARSRRRFDELQAEGADAGVVTSEVESLAGEVENPGGASLSGRQALFGIVQGASHLDLRRESLERTVEIDFDGYAIGGLSVGEEKSVMYEVVAAIAPQMPAARPRYLMGVGTPEDLVECVARGVDMFDCVLPTRNGRTGQAFTRRGKLNIKNARWTRDPRPLDEACACAVCRRHSRAYLRHLYLTGEMLASILLTHHNLAFFLDTMRRVRQSIRSGDFTRFRREFIEAINSGIE
ncbi:MAG: queuine tRNA-ribosyltransferase [Blastocatellia bacterium]|jgi:queuine tRNA-ribosyltransferase|nr:queuine tRNA-ribosyltransferase [Blastocatellia bacterium]